MRAELAILNDCAVLFLSRTAVSLSCYDINYALFSAHFSFQFIAVQSCLKRSNSTKQSYHINLIHYKQKHFQLYLSILVIFLWRCNFLFCFLMLGGSPQNRFLVLLLSNLHFNMFKSNPKL